MPSAAGRAPNAARQIPFHVGGVVNGAHYVELANHPDVYAQIHRWLVEAPDGLAAMNARE